MAARPRLALKRFTGDQGSRSSGGYCPVPAPSGSKLVAPEPGEVQSGMVMSNFGAQDAAVGAAGSGNPAADLGDLFRQFNPGLARGELPPAPLPGSASRCGDGKLAIHALRPGGALTDLLLHPAFVPLEQLYRKYPPDGIFTATRSNPCTMEIGALVVPHNHTFVLAEYEFRLFRLNGQLPGDVLPVEPRRFAMQLGYDVNFTQARRGNIEAEMLPTRAPVTQRAAFQLPATLGTIFQGPQVQLPGLPAAPALPDLYVDLGNPSAAPTTLSEVDVQRARSAVPTNPAGSALWPPTGRERQGPDRMPFTYLVEDTDHVQLRVTVFDAIRIPIAFFESRIAGYLIPTDAVNRLLKSMEVCW